MLEKHLEDLLNEGNLFLKPKDKGSLRQHLLIKQDYRCAVCNKDLSEEKNTNRHVDHSHKTKFVRGVLCATCNLVLGKIERAGYSQQWLGQLTNYLNNNKTNIVYPEKITGKRKTLKEVMKSLIKLKTWQP